MNRTWAVALIIIVSGAALTWATLHVAAGEYRLVSCYMPNEDVAALNFRNGLDQARSISFSNEGQFSTVQTNRTKFAIDWTDVIAIHAPRAASNTRLRRLSMAYRNSRTFEFGLIDDDCYSRVKERYGASLRFVE